MRVEAVALSATGKSVLRKLWGHWLGFDEVAGATSDECRLHNASCTIGGAAAGWACGQDWPAEEGRSGGGIDEGAGGNATRCTALAAASATLRLSAVRVPATVVTDGVPTIVRCEASRFETGGRSS